MKKCGSCKQIKDIVCFAKDISKKDGLRAQCRECIKLFNEKRKDKIKQYRLENKESISKNKRRYYLENIEKFRELNKQNQEKKRTNYLIKKYNISAEDYRVMYDKQNDCCAICKRPEIKVRRKLLMVDHCHRTNRIRELLCSDCNLALGGVKDDLQIASSLVDYLRKHSS
jgi:hypothetical protein